MTAKKLAANLIDTRWETSESSNLALTSAQKLGSFTIDAKLPTEHGVLDFTTLAVELILRIDKIDAGSFLINAPFRALISQNMGSTARWYADGKALKVTGKNSLEAAGEVDVVGNVLEIPAALELTLEGDELIADFSAQYIFPHVKLPIPGVPEVYDLPIDLAGRLVFEQVD